MMLALKFHAKIKVCSNLSPMILALKFHAKIKVWSNLSLMILSLQANEKQGIVNVYCIVLSL